MNNNPTYHTLLFMLFIIVSSHDTGSYIVGSFIGKHIIAPEISPKKSWEGFIGGVLFASTGLCFVLLELGIKKTPLFIFIFALSACILALCGDLLESWLKRRAHIKDSGTILPGHGGFLDRFDGILFTVIFFYAFRDYLVTLFRQ